MPLILTNAKGTVRLDRQPFPNEVALQEYIHDHPEAIPLDEIGVESNLLVLVREFRTVSGPVDVLATDRDANPFLIERSYSTTPTNAWY
jgi:RecB family endonuclease NucS